MLECKRNREGGRSSCSTRTAWWVVAALAVSFFLHTSARAELVIEETGRSLKLPAEMGAHWVWAGDIALRRTTLFDADNGRMLGMLNAGRELRPVYAYVSRDRGEVYIVETYYERGHLGARFGVVTIYDSETLNAVGAVEIPNTTADGALGPHYASVLDDGRFLVVFNQTPATSISVVDLEARSFVAEIDTPGCVLAFPSGPRTFLMLCGDGKPVLVSLDESGRERGRAEGEKFFDAVTSPVSDRGVRLGNAWYFVDFEGGVHPVDVSGAIPKPSVPWSLLSEEEKRAGWRPGGRQHVAAHAASGRLFVIMHADGGPGSHKNAGQEIWVFDVAERSRLARFEVTNLLVPYLETQAAGSTTDAVDTEDSSVLTGIARHLAGWILPNPDADSVVVTADANPVLIVGHTEYGALAVLDAATGDHLRDIAPTGIVGGGLVVP